jgi:hypothetical protein
MSKFITIFQRILRVIMFIVAAAMLVGAISLTGIHLANKNIEKTPVSGQIIYGDDLRSVHEVRYEWQGKTLERRPLDVYFRKLGDVGDKVTIYVENAHPERIFLSRQGNDLMSSAAFMGGWSLLLFVILLGERQLMSRMKRLEELEQKEKEEN